MGIASLVVLMLYLVGIAGLIAVANGGRVATADSQGAPWLI